MLYRFTLAKYRLWPRKGVFETPLRCVFAGLLGMELGGASNSAKAGVPYGWACPANSNPSLRPESGAMTFILWVPRLISKAHKKGPEKDLIKGPGKSFPILPDTYASGLIWA